MGRWRISDEGMKGNEKYWWTFNIIWDSKVKAWAWVIGWSTIQALVFEMRSWLKIFLTAVRGSWQTYHRREIFSMIERRELKCETSSQIGIWRKTMWSWQTGTSWVIKVGKVGLLRSIEGIGMLGVKWESKLIIETADLSQVVIQPYMNWKCSMDGL